MSLAKIISIRKITSSRPSFRWRPSPSQWYRLSSDKLVSMNSPKQDVESLLNKLPDDCSVEDIQYHLYVLDKVRRGLDDARDNGTLSQDEVESRLNKWLTE